MVKQSRGTGTMTGGGRNVTLSGHLDGQVTRISARDVYEPSADGLLENDSFPRQIC